MAYDTPVDNMLAHIDQASFLGLRALGHAPFPQFVWIYDRDVDIDSLRRFQQNLAYGLLGRRIERSPLPFGRHRWVAAGPSDGIEIAATDRPRSEIGVWADEQAYRPIDPEHGPGWRLSVQPLIGGGAAITLIASHSLADGRAACLAIAEASRDQVRELGYPPPRSRPWRRALLADIGQTAEDAPAMAKALVSAVRLARGNGTDLSSATLQARLPAVSTAHRRAPIRVPTAWLYIDSHAWDERAKALGGTSNTLFAGIAARLGDLTGRVRASDGMVTLSFPVSERTEGDSRANALTTAVVTVDPAKVTVDLTDIRSNVRSALTELAAQPNPMLEPLALTPLVPRRLARRLEGLALGAAGLPIGCSNLGVLDPAVNRPDGTDADYVSIRLVEPHITAADLDGVGGQLFLCSARVRGKVSITVVAYRSGTVNSAHLLREIAARAVRDFDLTATVM